MNLVLAMLGAVVAPAILGLGCVRWLGLGPEHGRRLALAYGYLVGHLALAAATSAWLLLGRPVPGWLLPLLAAIAGALLCWQRPATGPPRPAAREWWIWAPLVVVGIAAVDHCTLANAEPVRFGDEAVIWAAKAKALYAAPAPLLAPALSLFVQHPDYPLFQPLVQVLSFATVGGVLHAENRLPVQCFGLALLALLSAAATRRAHPLVAALGLVAFFGTAFSSVVLLAYADVMLAFAMLALVEALLRWRETRQVVFWRLAALAATAMLVTKNEGAMLLCAVAVPFACSWLLAWRRGRAPGLRTRELLWWSAPASALAAQMTFNAWFGLRSDLFDPAAGGGVGLPARIWQQAPDYLPQVIAHYARSAAADGSGVRLLALWATAALVARVLRRRGAGAAAGSQAEPGAAVALAVAGYVLVFTGTNAASLQWHLDTAAERTLLHVLPVAVVGLCAAIWPHAAQAPSPPSTATT